MKGKHDPHSWALWSFIGGFPVGWIVESFLTGGYYGYHTGAILGGIIAGSLAALFGREEALAANERALSKNRETTSADRRPDLP